MSRVYKGIIGVCEKFVPGKLRPLWEHPAGPKTIFFWAPLFKWGLVFTSMDQFRAPIETVSTSQSAALAATGFIWTRFCFTIQPLNYSLAICNFMLGLANGTQCVRAVRYQFEQKALAEGVVVDDGKDGEGKTKEL